MSQQTQVPEGQEPDGAHEVPEGSGGSVADVGDAQAVTARMFRPGRPRPRRSGAKARSKEQRFEVTAADLDMFAAITGRSLSTAERLAALRWKPGDDDVMAVSESEVRAAGRGQPQ